MEEIKKMIGKLNDTQRSAIVGSIILIIVICGDIVMSIGEIRDSYEIGLSMVVTAFLICGVFWTLGFLSSHGQ